MEAVNREGSSSSMSRRRSSYIISRAVLCFFFTIVFFFFFYNRSTLSSPGIRCPFSASPDLCFQEKQNGMEVDGRTTTTTPLARRRRLLLGGPGSSPPRCTSKCGKCTPCKPVHVPVPPGTPVTAEYYPEAWRCKCGNKLYMP